MASKVDSSGLSVITEERASDGKHIDMSDDYENIYNTQKTKIIYGGGHKKKLHPLMRPSRQNPGKIISLHSASKNNLSEFTQRIMSAKLIRTKQVQNQLNETQNQLNELINENRILRNMLKRQEGALKKYEGNHAELPQLIRSHNEEIRALKANNKIIKAQLRESNTKLKDRETELEALRDNYNKLKKLSTEKNLLEREKLQKKVEDLQEVIKGQEEKIQVLSRKVLLESKNYRHQLNIEMMKHKETQKDLTSALSMINKLERELVIKDKPLTSGKILLKRENKNLMPAIVSKSSSMQPKLGASEESFLNRTTDHRKSLMHDSPETELELLNSLGSSEETPSPIQDIFPDINASKKPSPEMKTTTEITYSNSDMIEIKNEALGRSSNKPRTRKNLKKNTEIYKNPTLSAKVITETLSEEMEAIDDLAEKVKSTTMSLDKDDTMNSLFEELKFNSAKLEAGDQLIKIDSESEKDNDNPVKLDGRRNVSKRKLEEERGTSELSGLQTEFDLPQDLSVAQQKKIENMTKTWNDLKSKIQEERMKAEEKMKELQKLGGEVSVDDSLSESEFEKAESTSPEFELKVDSKEKELNFVNFTDDAYILKELEKTDKIFNKLKTDSKKSAGKVSSSSSSAGDKKSKTVPAQKPKPKQPPDIKSFRTESRREPKYLEEFQNEYQKQNLLKALKAIDVGKDGNFSTDESENSESETKREVSIQQKNGLKHVKKLSSESDKSLMAELFGSKHRLSKNENLNLEYGTIASVNE